MTPYLLRFLCCPLTRSPLQLREPLYDRHGNIESGFLKSLKGPESYPIVDGIPRFMNSGKSETVAAFGDEWNFFNFTQFKLNWLAHTVANTWGGTEVFSNKLIVDAGAGSGAQSKWFLEYGAKHVIALELSHSVDGVIKSNLQNIDPRRYDIIQCSIDNPPILPDSIGGLVYCHNVIQHTPSVEKTANSLYGILAPGGEFVFNCYRSVDPGLLRWLRFNLVYKPLRSFLAKSSFKLRLFYCRFASMLRLLPGIGSLFEKAGFVVRGDVPVVDDERFFDYLIRSYRCGVLNTYDAYGAHTYQWLKSDKEILNIINSFDPPPSAIINKDKYFGRPPLRGCALRVLR